MTQKRFCRNTSHDLKVDCVRNLEKIYLETLIVYISKYNCTIDNNQVSNQLVLNKYFNKYLIYRNQRTGTSNALRMWIFHDGGDIL